MPTTKSAKKRLKTDREKRIRNLRVKRSLKALIKGLNQDIGLGKEEGAKQTLPETHSALDRAASRGLIHKNTAWRNKSRLTKRVNQLKANESRK